MRTFFSEPAAGADLRDAWRAVARRPASSLFIVAVLALGIGASTAVWCVVRDVLIAPLPYPDADRLVVIWDQNRELGIERSGPTPANVTDLRERNRAFDGVAAWYAGEPRTLMSGADPAKVAIAEVTHDFFAVIAREALLGRAFDAGEVAADARVAVLSHWLWRSRFGADAGIVGRPVVLDGEPFIVTGVMPPSFVVPNDQIGLWIPWNFDRGFANLGFVPRDYRYLRVIARLAAGVTMLEAQRDLDRLSAELAVEHPVNRGWSARLFPYKSDLIGDLRPALLALSAAVAFVLLIAFVNAANLLLVQLVGRTSEVSVRAALGASEWRLTRLVLIESTLLSLAASAAGYGIAFVALRSLLALAPASLPLLDGVTMGAGGISFAALVTAAVAAGLGILTAATLRARARSSATGLRSGAVHPGRRGLQAGLVVGQVAGAFALVVMAMLMVQSLAQLLAVDPGFRSERLLIARVFPDPGKYNSTALRLDYFDRLRAALAELPSVESVGASSGLPLNAFNNSPSVMFAPIGAPIVNGGPEAEIFMSTVGYIETMGMRLISGRLFDDRDRPDSTPVVVVNEQLADAAWPDRNPIGENIMLRFGRDRDFSFEVVGVVAGSRSRNMKAAPGPEAFRPHTQAAYVTMNVVVRTSLDDATALANAVRAEIAALDPSQPAHSITTMQALMRDDLASDNLSMWLLGALAAVALTLAAAGVYGVMAYSVRARTHEIGLRMALGARRETVAGLVLRRGGLLLVFGIGIGAAAALGAARLLTALLYGVRPTEPTTFMGAALVLGAAMLVACIVPALRAARVDPSTALRGDR